LGTLRSEYSIEQFEDALQRFAHNIPELIPKFERVSVAGSNTTIDLEFSHDMKGNISKIEVHYWKREKPNEWGESLIFTIEPKEYIDSPHITKIHYAGGNDKKYNEKIMNWLKSLLGSEKPQVAFSLKDFSKKVNRKLTDYKAFSKF
jgi:hypothetical protein